MEKDEDKSHGLKKDNWMSVLAVLKNIILAILWIGIIAFFIRKRREITISRILSYTPDKPALAAFMMLALFAIKSISMVIYSGILLAIDGILFPLPVAVLINFLGTVIMVTIPYLIGSRTGGEAAASITRKYPKAERLRELRTQNDFMFTFLVRMAGRLPSDVISLYMGAVGVNYKKYLFGSLLGMMSRMITFPVMGMSITDIHSPMFMISACVEISIIIVTTIVFYFYKRINK